MASDTLDESFTIRTAFLQRYKELVEERKLFPFMVDLFLLALIMGFLRGKKSESRRDADIIKVGQIRSDEAKLALEVIFGLLPGDDERARWNEALAYADGGLEQLWQEIETLGGLEVLRLVAEAKEKWPAKLEALLKEQFAARQPRQSS